MKKVALVFIAAVMFLLLSVAAAAQSSSDKPITVKVDNKVIDFPDAKPFIENGRTMVPVRFVSEALGAAVQWDSTAKTVKINRKDKLIVLRIGEKKATINGKTFAFDAAVQLRESRTFVPLRFVSEAFGERVDWLEGERIVAITKVPAYMQPMTQGEYIAGLVKALRLHNSPTEQQAYELAQKAGILSVEGYQYAPAQPLKRIEAARFALRAIRQWYEVVSKGITDEKLALLLKLMKNYRTDLTFHGEDFITKADALYAIKEVQEWKDASDRGKQLYQAFHKSLKVQNGLLSGAVPKSPGQNIFVQCEIYYKDGQSKAFENGQVLSVSLADIKAMIFFAYDLNTGTFMAKYHYKKLPSLEAVEEKVRK
jgi:hypothetical protein